MLLNQFRQAGLWPKGQNKGPQKIAGPFRRASRPGWWQNTTTKMEKYSIIDVEKSQ